ncbi:MAG: protein phosphatase 2C domain-containing protein [Oscillatoriaceae bacterium SKW80]|nr:protein phosphatase 2C domain-containing protein [Oscillatoriaceae bacterium SKYG93]MCX8120478.1 protein phosphatase 2C domain-containing protein [Oscillatoriaceae bacterium SKW80]MDW8452716.1 protein phosphatase 2C domain-containing protein [Oscillatoriaceae cyanobacterium SKYGB_i_bin93]HIK27214.1 protein phosphatase 2C domain-containing protein [Oscillatoriaceae cyanobacterium M7585_C2015_266]
MSSSEPPIYCINPGCANPRNSQGGQVCAHCQTPLVYRYLWAVGSAAAQVAPGEKISDRYYVVAPQIWLDTKPGEKPFVPLELPDEAIPYLRLYPHRLHIPEVYGFCHIGDETNKTEILLLENVPVDAVGNLYPTVVEAWPTASAVRQVYWLWQILQLWQPLSELGMAASLIVADNIRVEGWRIWLLELYADEAENANKKEKQQTRLQDLGNYWLSWINGAQPSLAQPLQEICEQLCRSDVNFEAIAQQLNQLLLEEAAKLPLYTKIATGTDTGPLRSHNEDTCYPTEADFKARNTPPNEQLIPYFTIVCDGVGGHEGGEVASQSAVNSIKPLIQALLSETTAATEITPPEVVMRQIEESIRVINNAIAAKNDSQGRSSRQRMGTTLVMALQLPQKVRTADGLELANSHELYIAHVGDSRAYWITGDYCQRLTVDDDVASREVRMGRCVWREALQRADAGALTQALGTRDAEFLSPNIQRFIIEEDGLLVLCSDGLSDNDLLELSWANYANAVLKGDMSLEDMVKALINLANEKNGHDNTSVAIAYYRLSPEPPVLFEPKKQPSKNTFPPDSPMSEASRELLYASATPKEDYKSKPKFKALPVFLGAFLAILLTAAAVIWQFKDSLVQFWQQPASSPSPTSETPEQLTPATPKATKGTQDAR